MRQRREELEPIVMRECARDGCTNTWLVDLYHPSKRYGSKACRKAAYRKRRKAREAAPMTGLGGGSR